MLLCCVFRSLALWPYLLSSRPMFHGAPALTPQGAHAGVHRAMAPLLVLVLAAVSATPARAALWPFTWTNVAKTALDGGKGGTVVLPSTYIRGSRARMPRMPRMPSVGTRLRGTGHCVRAVGCDRTGARARLVCTGLMVFQLFHSICSGLRLY